MSLERNLSLGVVHVVEGLALVVLCSCRPATRRLAVNVLKEVRALHTALSISKVIFLGLQGISLCWKKQNMFKPAWKENDDNFVQGQLHSIFSYLIFQGDEELAIDVMDRLSASVLESFIHLTGADQVWMDFLFFFLKS